MTKVTLLAATLRPLPLPDLKATLRAIENVARLNPSPQSKGGVLTRIVAANEAVDWSLILSPNTLETELTSTEVLLRKFVQEKEITAPRAHIDSESELTDLDSESNPETGPNPKAADQPTEESNTPENTVKSSAAKDVPIIEAPPPKRLIITVLDRRTDSRALGSRYLSECQVYSGQSSSDGWISDRKLVKELQRGNFYTRVGRSVGDVFYEGAPTLYTHLRSLSDHLLAQDPFFLFLRQTDANGVEVLKPLSWGRMSHNKTHPSEIQFRMAIYNQEIPVVTGDDNDLTVILVIHSGDQLSEAVLSTFRCDALDPPLTAPAPSEIGALERFQENQRRIRTGEVLLHPGEGMSNEKRSRSPSWTESGDPSTDGNQPEMKPKKRYRALLSAEQKAANKKKSAAQLEENKQIIQQHLLTVTHNNIEIASVRDLKPNVPSPASVVRRYARTVAAFIQDNTSMTHDGSKISIGIVDIQKFLGRGKSWVQQCQKLSQLLDDTQDSTFEAVVHCHTTNLEYGVKGLLDALKDALKEEEAANAAEKLAREREQKMAMNMENMFQVGGWNPRT
ncbi:hypothetical protein R3P38DRAFT_3231766 [Favolaschia claudopus]|uniref:Uncharacterized protein n=1 Tax=Favolaschia claudopus TaxID=2862362 RepID=A0AAV9ZK11_9AGAR